jgi:hypothetical protein
MVDHPVLIIWGQAVEGVVNLDLPDVSVAHLNTQSAHGWTSINWLLLFCSGMFPGLRLDGLGDNGHGCPATITLSGQRQLG